MLDQMAAYLTSTWSGGAGQQVTGGAGTHHVAEAAGASQHRCRLRSRAAGRSHQPTDVGSFNQASVACLNLYRRARDYHKPSDTADKINYEDLGSGR
jgi:hypothetical protein